MKKVLLGILLIVLVSCSTKESKQQEQIDTWNKRITDFSKKEESRIGINPPIDLSTLKSLSWLETTSSVLSAKAVKELCEVESSAEFYGFYHLFDKRGLHKTIGDLVVLVPDRNKPWRFDNSDESFSKIRLESNSISVWDSIQVGQAEDELKKLLARWKFSKQNNEIYAKMGNYAGVFQIDRDTISEITINLICKK